MFFVVKNTVFDNMCKLLFGLKYFNFFLEY